MAVETFDQIYARLSADERKLFDNVIAKEPELKKGWLRQDEFSRSMNDFSSKQKEFDDLRSYKEKMDPWSQEVHVRIKRAEDAGVMDADGNPLWESKEEEYKRQIAAAAVGGDMDPKELEKRVRDIVTASGGVTKEELNALVAAESRKLMSETFDSKYKEVENNFNQKTIPTVAGFSAGVAVFASKYEKETGEAWTEDKAKELFDLMGKEQNFNAYQVGDKMLAPVREKKTQELEIEKRVQERLKTMGLPGSGDGEFIPQNFNQPKGALQLALERSAEGEKDVQAIIREQTVKAAQSLQQDGKF